MSATAPADAPVIEIPGLEGKSLTELRGELDATSKKILEIFEQAGPSYDMSKVTVVDGDSAAKVAEIRRLKAVEDRLGEVIDERNEFAGIFDSSKAKMKTSAGRVTGPQRADTAAAEPTFPGIKALIDQSAESGGIKALRSQPGFTGRLPLFSIDDPDVVGSWLAGKATIALTDIAPLADRQPQIVPSAQVRVTVSDLMAPGTTDSNTVTYYEETTFTNAAAETAEGVAKAESTLDFTERTDTVRKIATWIPITDEALNDNRQLRSYVEARLVYMVRQREEAQLITGNGTPPNIQGILNRSGIQTQAKGADPTPDAFFKAMMKVRTTGDADPDGHVIHPNDWQDIRLLRTADGIYIWGNPSEAGPERLWGLPVRVTTGITEGTGLTGAFGTFAQVFRRSGLTVVASTEHASFFVENKVALLAETRLALAVYRPAAFASVTGI